MVTTEGRGSARTPLEALLLALQHSRSAHLTGADVLRQVLSGCYRDLVHGGNFDLAPVWDLLASQPGFDPAELMPAFAKVKSWESKLDKKVALPPLMQELGDSELAEMAASVHVPATELVRVLGGGMVQSEQADQARAIPAESTPSTRREATRVRLGPRQRRTATVAAGVVAALAFSFAGITLARDCRGREWSAVAVDFAGDLPLARVERSGPEVAATLRDPAWLTLPAGRRQDQMTAALRALPTGVEVLFVRDRAGKLVAAARWYGKRPRQIAVTLR